MPDIIVPKNDTTSPDGVKEGIQEKEKEVEPKPSNVFIDEQVEFDFLEWLDD